MEKHSSGKPPSRRRSSRILLRLPLLVSAADSGSDPQWEKVETIMVSSHGGMIRARQKFTVGTTLDIRMQNGEMKSARARVVWEAAQQTPRGAEVGFEILDDADFWGISFPPESWDASGAG
jgi:PilZ domain